MRVTNSSAVRLAKRRVESQHDRAVEPGRGQQPQFGGLVGQPEQRLAGVEESARMRLEGQRRRRPAERRARALRRRDHGLMAAMDAIEIADGDDRAAQRFDGAPGAPSRTTRKVFVGIGASMVKNRLFARRRCRRTPRKVKHRGKRPLRPGTPHCTGD